MYIGAEKMRKGGSCRPSMSINRQAIHTRPVCSILNRGMYVQDIIIGSDSASLNQRNFSRLALAEKMQES